MPDLTEARKSLPTLERIRQAVIRLEAAESFLRHADAGDIQRKVADQAATELVGEACGWLRRPA